MARVVGFRCKDKPALPPAGVGEYLPPPTKPPPPPPLPSVPPEWNKIEAGREDESLSQVIGCLMPPMTTWGKGKELESGA